MSDTKELKMTDQPITPADEPRGCPDCMGAGDDGHGHKCYHCDGQGAVVPYRPSPVVDGLAAELAKDAHHHGGVVQISDGLYYRLLSAVRDWEQHFTALSLRPAPETTTSDDVRGEPVAWIKPNWQSPESYDGTSPVSTYYTRGWLPLYLANLPKPTDDVVEARGKLTAEYLAMTPLQKWDTLTLHGLLGTNEPWIADMRDTLANLPKPTEQATSPAPDAVMRERVTRALLAEAPEQVRHAKYCSGWNRGDEECDCGAEDYLARIAAALASLRARTEEKGYG